MTANSSAGTGRQSRRIEDDCTPCRIVGGLFLMGASWYVFTGIRSQDSRARPLVFLFGAGLGYVGLARIAQWPPFKPDERPKSPVTKKKTTTT